MKFDTYFRSMPTSSILMPLLAMLFMLSVNDAQAGRYSYDKYFKRFEVATGYEWIKVEQFANYNGGRVPGRKTEILIQAAMADFRLHFPVYEFTDEFTIGLSPGFLFVAAPGDGGSDFGDPFANESELSGSSEALLALPVFATLSYGAGASLKADLPFGARIGAGYEHAFAIGVNEFYGMPMFLAELTAGKNMLVKLRITMPIAAKEFGNVTSVKNHNIALGFVFPFR